MLMAWFFRLAGSSSSVHMSLKTRVLAYPGQGTDAHAGGWLIRPLALLLVPLPFLDKEVPISFFNTFTDDSSREFVLFGFICGWSNRQIWVLHAQVQL